MTNVKKQLWIIVNPISGVKAKKSAIALLEEELAAHFDIKIKTTKAANHATKLATKAVDKKVDAIVAIGGDGTVNEVAKALIHTTISLAVIPFGSGNGFARHLGIPLDAVGAIKKIKEFKVQRIDTATFNGNPFVVTAGIGFDAQIAHEFANFGKRGFIAYSQVTLNAFLTYKPKSYTLKIDGNKIKSKALLICFANAGQYGNNAWIAPTASLTDGKIKVCILKPFPHHLSPDILLKTFNKNLVKSSYYEVYNAEKVTIKKSRKFHLDGEPYDKAKKKMVIKVVPNSLNVIC